LRCAPNSCPQCPALSINPRSEGRNSCDMAHTSPDQRIDGAR
jgi:hypothetical protein